MKGLNYRFPHSRQDSGQANRGDKSLLNQGNQGAQVMHIFYNHLIDGMNTTIILLPPQCMPCRRFQYSLVNLHLLIILKNPPFLKPKQTQQMSFLNYLILKKEDEEQEKQVVQQQQNQHKQQQSSFMQNNYFPNEVVVQRNMFNFLYVIGIGGFGKVWRVEHKKNGQTYAMKEMSKALYQYILISKGSLLKKVQILVINERSILSNLKHPFLVNIYFAFQDRENLFLVLDYMQGGDLRYHIGRMRRFSEDQTRFFMACIFLGLEHMHSKNIIHRDIKPENLVLDKNGYVRITDLGIARVLRPDNAQDTSGTPGYMAPEVMCRQNHSYAVDYFALGVIGYEFMLGKRPYTGRSRKEIRDQILAKQVQIKRSEIPDNWSLESADFINRLIQRKPANRLGFNEPQELRQHSWFKNFPWQKLYNKELKAPFIPHQTEDNFDARQISIEDEENNELIQKNVIMLRRNSIQALFNGYELDNFTQANEPIKQQLNNSNY
ncbi:unnamed protein product (macronuclear) [Paramecium tetraurelia]|uniref:non-specific serine/threonine protein kinase n=1 Tax=Paramecium tetraurelia TaxID=5888 RepID=A0DPJ3_PARTE|nr:uncharacterized protein GSPATT00019142001 [Paramecium tetraurelia]CAK84960.1 unnamed protein product [Paramecium tetraurelia]|eukprot:XP_001452357.1 hypothetical protein (macronuclear) [Paramecium tetraurelia strain d4-2]